MVVVPATPVRRILIWLGLALMVPVAGLTGYLFALYQSDLDRELLGHMSERVGTLASELEDVRRQLTDSKLTAEVDSQAVAIQREEMAGLRETIRDLREQMSFYRRLMDSSATDRPLEIADLEIVGSDTVGDSRFRLLLTRPTELGDWVDGTLWLEVIGVQRGETSALSLAQVSDLESYPIEFKFRYFQRLSGSLRLPEGFVPRSVSVRVAFGSGNSAEVDRSFPWPGTLVSG